MTHIGTHWFIIMIVIVIIIIIIFIIIIIIGTVRGFNYTAGTLWPVLAHAGVF